MHRVTLIEAQQQLPKLVAEASQGESVIITQENGPTVQLVRVASAHPYPQFGSAKGKVKMAEDFDAFLDDFGEYAP